MPEPLAHDIIAPRSPRVTVFIPAYNAERYIGEAIESILAQTFTDFELLIIDDASTDRTPAVIADFADDVRLRLVVHAENRGRPRTRNHGLDIANGEYIAFLDADDSCVPERLARQVAYLDAHLHIDGVGSWKAWIDECGRPASEGIRRFPADPHDVACEMLAECTLGQTSMMVRSAAFSGYRYDDTFPVAEDYELWARMIRTCGFANIPETLTAYRRHAAQSISTHREAQRASDLAIYGKQIDALGVPHDPLDLARHERLFKFASRHSVLEYTGKPLDIDYLRWARGWLASLRDANERVRIYPEPEFSRMLAARWLFALRKATRNSAPWKIVAEFAKCPLNAALWSLLTYRLRRLILPPR